ncbi:MAG: beta-ketoacyl synthase N-terminal-like domain-containing protein [Acidobacteriota bacterium]
MTHTPDALREAIVRGLCEAVGSTPDQIDSQAPFASYGLGSRDAVVLSGDLEEWLGQPVSPTVFYDHPTLDALVAHLASVGPASGAGATREPPDEHAPVAIIGLGCRFPGAPDARRFWELLDNGRDAIGRLPDARRALMGEDLAAMLPAHGLLAGYIDDVDAFDAPFFGIGATEAEGMDPQQRLLLELAIEALEDAGQPADGLGGSRTGVFIGMSTSDYALLRMRLPEAQRIDAYCGTSNSPSVAAGRIAYVLGLQGPAFAIDTACSSSLSAVHLAYRSVRDGESDMALAGGVNLMLAPETTLWACQARILSEDGRCRTFDRAANGYVRGEGAGLVVLKRLADAQRDRDPIAAVIRGSAAGHDGRSSGLTAPNGVAQQKVVVAALADAHVAPGRVHYVEAHGTGTVLGDPIEVRALGAALCVGRPPSQPLVLGSVKTNIGHLEAAAGIAGLLKVVLALREGRIPPHLHLTALNPYIAAEALPIEIPSRSQAWPVDDAALVAGVSSFGLSGTNVHVVLSRAPWAAPISPQPAGPMVLPVSARSEAALRRRAQDLVAWLRRERPLLADVCGTAGARRAHYRHRIAVWGETLDELCAALLAWLDGRADAHLAEPTAVAAAEHPAPPRDTAPGESQDAAHLAVRYVRGEDLDWPDVCRVPYRTVALPTYPFDRHRYWMARPAAARGATPAGARSSNGIALQLDAANAAARDDLLLRHLRESLAVVIQTSADQVPADRPLASLGLDSLMAIDLTNRLSVELGVQVPPAELLEKMTLAELVSLVLDLRQASQLRNVSPPGASGTTVQDVIL